MFINKKYHEKEEGAVLSIIFGSELAYEVDCRA